VANFAVQGHGKRQIDGQFRLIGYPRGHLLSKPYLEKALIWRGVFERLAINLGHTKGGVGQIMVNVDSGLRGLVIATSILRIDFETP
jgi:hypothetical protein